MVRLNDDYQQNPESFEKVGIVVPKFDQKEITEAAENQPIWVHFGGGNLFRCFHAKIAQNLLNSKELKAGVIVAETYDDGVVNQAYKPYNNRVLQVVMDEKGNYDKTLVVSVADAIYYNHTNTAGWSKLKHVFEQPSLQFVTMSITEKGYALRDVNGNLSPAAVTDIDGDPEAATTNMGAIARLLLARFNAGKLPIAMVSTDNFSENGKRFEEGILTIAEGWAKHGTVSQDFVDYLKNPQLVSFPWSMIDRITPNPAESVASILKDNDFEDTGIIHTDKHTNIAPFGNTEVTHYLVIEDSFPNGRPALEKAGVILTSRDVVNDADQMKVTACLNPLHTGLAIFGSLLGYTSIADEMENQDFVALIKQLGYNEDLPVVKDPKIINPKAFIDEVINKRLPNKNIPDTPQRIASDTSQKLAIRYGVTLQHYLDSGKSTADLKAIPLIIAGWCRFLMAIQDDGQAFEPSRDPLLSELQPYVATIQLGDNVDAHEVLKPILSNQSIFSVDLDKAGLTSQIETYFTDMIAAPGAVAKTLHSVINA
ncbi:mannitol dehydrogenase family protein [Lactiplantibacillus paraplantarum]|uniref:Mannitol dehydrogenase n=1 Tax=Lactiplantibacillus paraplantarum TaxID=60520 RepID=A0ABQ0NC17_9LACO|nr:mannitol dehydrogenase family protein [Lactiplantibacillus paraplantarum]ERL45841.1 Fructuronate reductase [Lactiplantibacillus paraplantarum]MCU4685152.1 mannitol dehydrogenase family protein [Lactiplantibacillus paraplantarum]QJU50870.1 fructuronate reductase [Lactiplantibacillus paraplantarum]UKB40365.1 mannitol dehydrogenase family protein [Lactiplantibacillus paraplantarum]GBF02556.1 mannitol dehydrogenase [Lactiplantibacillus paraplantarum]